MFKKYIVFTLAIILLLIPVRTYAVEEVEEGTTEQNPNNNINNDESYVEPWVEEPYVEPWTNDTYEEPYVEPWVEDPYIEPWYDDTYEEPVYPNDGQNDQSVTYEEPYVEEIEEPERYIEPEPEIEVAPEPAEVSISSVVSENYNVSGTVVGDDEIKAGVLLILTGEDEIKETTSDEDGAFVFNDVPNGTYSLSAEDSEDYEIASELIEVTVDNRNKLGYEITIEEVQPEPEVEEDLPIEAAETDERAEETEGSTISGFELSLIIIASVLLLITIAIVLFRKLSRR